MRSDGVDARGGDVGDAISIPDGEDSVVDLTQSSSPLDGSVAVVDPPLGGLGAEEVDGFTDAKVSSTVAPWTAGGF